MNRPLRLRRAARARGFTLVELLVATVAGLTVSLGAFAFARAATRSFQQELRLSDATSGVTIGFRRLVADIERAGYLAPSNVQREFSAGNRVCLQPNNVFSKAIQSLSSLQIEQGPVPTTGSVPNVSAHVIDATTTINLAPDRLTLAGSYASAEQYSIKSVELNGATPIVYLEPQNGAALRTANGNGTVTPWANVFRLGRIMRIVDRQGYQHFGHITQVDMAGAVPKITLENTPGLFIRGQAAPTTTNPVCKGFEIGTGGQANVIDRVRYEVRDLKNDVAYNDLYANPVLDEDKQRWELVRYELDRADNIIQGTTELVAEFAVDLKFAVTAITGGVGVPVPNPVVGFFNFGDPNIGNTWGKVVGPANQVAGPERVRSVRVRLAVRSREPDRAAGINPVLMGSEPGTLFRYKIPGSNRFARVRTLHAEVAMSNQTGVFF